jgi:hypothetical protein
MHQLELLFDIDSIQLECTVILEAVASKIYGFGTLSSALLVLTMTSTCSSSLRYCQGLRKAMINGHAYNKCYYLADDIYHEWSTLVKTICGPIEEKNKRFVKQQEACRKDVEQSFGVLQSRWAIV